MWQPEVNTQSDKVKGKLGSNRILKILTLMVMACRTMGEWIFIEQPPGSGIGVFYWIPSGGGIGAGPEGGHRQSCLGAKQFQLTLLPSVPRPSRCDTFARYA